MHLSNNERQELWFQRFKNGYHLSDGIKQKDYLELTELQKSKQWKDTQYSNLDLVWLARMANATGTLITEAYECTGNGCHWLAPYYSHVHDTALIYFLNKNWKDPKEVPPFEVAIKEFGDLFSQATPRDLATMENDVKKLQFHLTIVNFLQNPVKRMKIDINRPSSDDRFETLFEFDFKRRKENYLKSSPYKRMKLDKDNRWDVDMWDGRRFTAMKEASMDKLLQETGHSFRMKDFEKQVGFNSIDKEYQEMNEKRIIRGIALCQYKQKGVNRDQYYKKINRMSQIGTLFHFGFIDLMITRDYKKAFSDKHWLDAYTPKMCCVHHTPEIVNISAVMTDEGAEMFPEFNLNQTTNPSVRDCEKMFNKIRKQLKFKV